MLRFFLQFLRSSFSIMNDDIAIRCYYYAKEKSFEDIQGYWLRELGLPESCFKGFTVRYTQNPLRTKPKKTKYGYGICRITIHNVKVVQTIYGGIQEFSGFENTKWLNVKYR